MSVYYPAFVKILILRGSSHLSTQRSVWALPGKITKVRS